MKNFFVFRNLKSNYCKIVFLVSLIVGYLLIPKDVLFGQYAIIAITFIIIISLTITCVTRTIKEQIKASINLGNSIVGVLASIVGITALQVCGLGIPACGASVGAGFVSLIFPGFVFNFLREYSVFILTFSIFAQIYSLYKMNCFIANKQNY